MREARWELLSRRDGHTGLSSGFVYKFNRCCESGSKLDPFSATLFIRIFSQVFPRLKTRFQEMFYTICIIFQTSFEG